MGDSEQEGTSGSGRSSGSGGSGGSGEPLGSVGDEAAKLFDALQDWAKDGGPAGAEGLAGGLADQWRTVNEHVANGGQDCTYCPVCQVIHKVRESNPEVRTHLAVAASSLLQAAATLIEARAPRPAAGEPQVTKIDLDDDDAPRG